VILRERLTVQLRKRANVRKREDRYIEKSKEKKTPLVKYVRGVSGDRGKAELSQSSASFGGKPKDNQCWKQADVKRRYVNTDKE